MDLSVEGWQETEDELRLYVISVSYRLPLLSHSCLRKPEKVCHCHVGTVFVVCGAESKILKRYKL